MPILRQTLLDVAVGTNHIMIISDADGNILWREGEPRICRDADRVQLAEGTRWPKARSAPTP